MIILAETYRLVAHQAMLDLVRQPREVVYAADPYIAALEAENEKLRGCGNCMWCAAREITYDRQRMYTVTTVFFECICEGKPAVTRFDSCHFTPSRWTAREEAGDE